MQYWSSYRAGVYLCDLCGVWMPSFGGLLPLTLSGSNKAYSFIPVPTQGERSTKDTGSSTL